MSQTVRVTVNDVLATGSSEIVLDQENPARTIAMAAYFAMLAAGYQPTTVVDAFEQVVAEIGPAFQSRNTGPNLAA
jgi:hypothetical protein